MFNGDLLYCGRKKTVLMCKKRYSTLRTSSDRDAHYKNNSSVRAIAGVTCYAPRGLDKASSKNLWIASTTS